MPPLIDDRTNQGQRKIHLNAKRTKHMYRFLAIARKDILLLRNDSNTIILN